MNSRLFVFPAAHRSLRQSQIPVVVATLSLLVTSISCGSPSGASTSGDESGLSGKVVLTGSSTVAPLLAEIGLRFEAKYPGTRVDVQTGGSSRGISDARSGVADLGMSSRDLLEGEAPALRQHPVAFDGVAFVVHASNPVQELSDDDLRRIYTGALDQWRDLGGVEASITVVNRAAGRSEVQLVTEYLGVEARALKGDLIAGENQHAIKTVLGDPSAIAYLSLGAARREVEAGQPLRLLPLRGIPATVEALRSGEFPLARPLLLLSRSEPKELAAALVAFAQSEAVDDLITSLAYVPPQRSREALSPEAEFQEAGSPEGQSLETRPQETGTSTAVVLREADSALPPPEDHSAG